MNGHSQRLVHVAAGAAFLILLLVLRVPLLFTRPVFFDELFSVWIASQSLSSIFRHLQHDSGPPLYYLLLHSAWKLLPAAPTLIDAVLPARFLSLITAVIGLFLFIWSRRLGGSRWIAGLLLGLLPSSVYFSTESRAYALCALFIGGAGLALLTWAEEESRKHLAIASGLLILAAYTHYYGVLFFPVPVALALMMKRRAALSQSIAASACCGLAFLPGFLLARAQPAQAMAWLETNALRGFWVPAQVVRQLGFAVPYPGNFLASPPLSLQLTSLAVSLAVLAYGTVRSQRARILALITLVPVLMMLVLSWSGMGIYFPFRFESVLGMPFVVWFAVSLEQWTPKLRRIVLAIVLLMGSYVSYSAVLESAVREPDPFRQSAIFARQRVPSDQVIVATGPSYLETVSQRGGGWTPRVVSWPTEQSGHPGWRPVVGSSVLEREVQSLPREFFWVGESVSKEYAILKRFSHVEPRFLNGPLIVARVRMK